MYALTIIQLSYTSIALVAYAIMIFIVLSIRRNLKTFAKLLLTSSFINILGSLNVLIQSRLIRDPSFFGYYQWMKSGVEGFPLYLRIFHFTWYLTGWQLQYACTFLTTLNRFTAIVMYEKHEKAGVWRFSPIIIVVALGAVLASSIPSINSIGTYSYRPVYNDYSLDYSADINEAVRVFRGMFIYSAFFITTSAIMMIWSMLKVRNTFNKSDAVGRIERNLFILSLINFGAMFLNFISFLVLLAWQICFPQVQGLQDFLDIFYPICSDIFCLTLTSLYLGLPFYTLILPGPVKSELIRKLRRGNNATQIASTGFALQMQTMSNAV